MSLSKNQMKLVQSLRQKKYRNKHQLFVAEGVKVVKELLDSSFELDSLFVVAGNETAFESEVYQVIEAADLKKISSLKNTKYCVGTV